MMNSIKLKDHTIGAGSPAFIIAEVGLNHNGSYELAERSIRAAAESGADSVKFQNFLTEDFLTDRSIQYTYVSRGKEITEPLWEICKRSEFRNEWIAPLKRLCDDLGIVFMSTPTSENGVDDLIRNGVEALKNGSDYITHLPLLRYMGSTGAMVIISTGMATGEDISNALSAVREGGKSPATLLHCVSSYPTKEKDVNLRKIAALKDTYNVPVGFSDHTEGWAAAVQAATLGACIIEKHFTLDRELPGPDHRFSSTPDELKELVREVRFAEMRMGNDALVPSESEMEHRDEFRVGIVADRDLAIGDKMTRESIAIRKPAFGLLPKDIDKYIGKTFKVSLKRGDPVKDSHLE
ncbi:MAG: N-acetylneuraminate synthase family protein [Nitrospirae bacterium]|nr:N-acetylneuraminate synthase family protein [Nitrospirota bacterium]